LKEVLSTSSDLEFKSVYIDQELELNLKYLSSRTLEKQKEMNKIMAEFKKT